MASPTLQRVASGAATKSPLVAWQDELLATTLLVDFTGSRANCIDVSSCAGEVRHSDELTRPNGQVLDVVLPTVLNSGHPTVAQQSPLKYLVSCFRELDRVELSGFPYTLQAAMHKVKATDDDLRLACRHLRSGLANFAMLATNLPEMYEYVYPSQEGIAGGGGPAHAELFNMLVADGVEALPQVGEIGAQTDCLTQHAHSSVGDATRCDPEGVLGRLLPSATRTHATGVHSPSSRPPPPLLLPRRPSSRP